jgi:hypothetical protein
VTRSSGRCHVDDRPWGDAPLGAATRPGLPVLEHPILHNDYHSYLSTSGGYGGHFQVGRGYHVDSTGDRFVRIFEPYNEPDWTGWTATTWGPQQVQAFKALDANQANSSFKNIGI